MDDDLAMKVIFQDTSILSLLQSGVVNRGTDLGPALMRTPTLLTKHMDPNASRKAKLVASAKVDHLLHI